MKFKTTAKSIRESYGAKLAISYCGAQYLLHFHNPVAYTCGVYGWNFDVYTVDGVTICTGYRGMVGRSVDYALLSEYESKARAVCYDRELDYETKREEVDKLLSEFVERAIA